MSGRPLAISVSMTENILIAIWYSPSVTAGKVLDNMIFIMNPIARVITENTVTIIVALNNLLKILSPHTNIDNK